MTEKELELMRSTYIDLIFDFDSINEKELKELKNNYEHLLLIELKDQDWNNRNLVLMAFNDAINEEEIRRKNIK